MKICYIFVNTNLILKLKTMKKITKTNLTMNQFEDLKMKSHTSSNCQIIKLPNWLIAVILTFNFSLFTFNSFSQSNVGDTISMYEINFDTAYHYINIDTSSHNLWQVGTPHKTYFNSAYSSAKAIVTDTVNDYPVNNYSYFDLYIGSFNFPLGYPYDIFIDFWHKFDTDTLKDGGYITVSWDKGLTWMNIINDSVYGGYYYFGTPCYDGYNLYTATDTLYNGEYGFSGRSNGWVHTGFAWYIFPVKLNPPDTMILRFNFISDSINNPKEGWMIDSIRLFSIDLGSGIHNLLAVNNTVKVFPNPFNSGTVISLNKTYETVKLEVYDMQGKLLEQKEYPHCNKINFNRAGLSNGSYFFKITLNNSSIETRKIMINDEH